MLKTTILAEKNVKVCQIKKTSVCCALLALLVFIAASVLTSCGNNSSAQPVSDTQVQKNDSEQKQKEITVDEVRLMLENGETVSDGDFAAPINLATPSNELNITAGVDWHSMDESICAVSDGDIIIGGSIGDTYLWRVDGQGSVHTVKIRVRKAVYLTIDDWPNPTTRKILDVLKEYNVRATFFLNASNYYKELYAPIRDAGHSIGNHTYSHASTSIFKDKETALSQFKRMNEFLKETIDVEPKIVRIPGGSYSKAAIDGGLGKRKEFLKTLHDNGYRIFDWTATLGDSSKTASPRKSVYSVASTCCKDFEIILMHHKKTSLQALPDVIKLLRERNYEFFPITDSTPEYIFA